MKVHQTELPGVLLVEPKIFGDARGFFLETYNESRYREQGIDVRFVQDNHSRSSTQGVLRGLHYQVTKPQAKLVWAISGRIWDVAVDIRPDSPTYKKWVGAELTGESKKQIFVPAGYAHGFCVLSESAEVMYKCTDLYDPSDEGGIIWNDPELKIPWPISSPVLSAKDAQLPELAQARR